MKKFFAVIILLCSTAVYAQNEDDVFREIASKVSSLREKMKNGTIAVFPFEAHGFKDPAYGNYIADKIAASLSRTGKLTLVEREKLNRLMKEKELSLSGIVKQNEAVQIGSLLAIDAIILGRVYRSEKGIDIMVKVIDTQSGVVLKFISLKDTGTSGVLKKEQSGFTGKWNVIKTAPYLEKQKLRYEKFILNKDGGFSLHLINNTDREVEIRGSYRINRNNIDYRVRNIYFDGNRTSFTRKSEKLHGTIYLIKGQLYFNYTGEGKKRKRLDAMKPEYRCVGERSE